jgi:formylmethanofuran dehydrogenase subunit E
MERLRIDSTSVDLGDLIDRGTLLHGHLGPYLVAGIRMGLLALQLLEHPGYFEIQAESKAGSVTPQSCLNDGVQIGSGCTAGKGNLRIVGSDAPSVRFRTDNGRWVEIALRPEVVATFRDSDIREASERLRTLPQEELFTWTGPSSS